MADSTLAVGVGVAVVVASALGFVVGRQRLRYAVLVLGGLAVVALSAAVDPGSALRARDVAVAVGPMAALLATTAVLAPRRTAWVAVVGAVLAGPVRALVYDPFLDLHCVDCRPSGVVLDPHLGLAEWLEVVGPVLGLVALGLQAARTRKVGESVLAPVAVSIALVVVLLGEDLAHPLAVVAATAAVVGQDHHGAVAERRLRDLVEALRSGRPLADVLRDAWGDDDVEVSYWLPEDGAWVTPAGVARRPPPPGATRLRWAGVVTAAVEQRGRADLGDLEPALDVPARLTLDNERLSAALAARVRQVSRSRSLVVELGDRERRRIERDLHDGVQQQLLALGLDLRGALADLPTGHPDRPVLESCLANAQRLSGGPARALARVVPPAPGRERARTRAAQPGPSFGGAARHRHGAGRTAAGVGGARCLRGGHGLGLARGTGRRGGSRRSCGRGRPRPRFEWSVAPLPWQASSRTWSPRSAVPSRLSARS